MTSHSLKNVARCIRVAPLLLAFYAAGAWTLHAQDDADLRIPGLELLRSAAAPQVPAASARPGAALDAPVVAEEYILGPGDQLGINIWSSAPKEYTLTVTPEGYCIVPGVGRVIVGDSTLASVQRTLGAKLARYYPSADVSVSLLSPRSVIVEITGLVVNEGRYQVSSVDRVDRLLRLANEPRAGQERSPQYAAELEFARYNASDRGIVLRRRNGRTQRVDLLRHSLEKAGGENPYLVEGDVVHVPQRSPLMKTLGAFGGVNRSGTFEHVEGDRLTFLLAMALGLKPQADSAHGLLTRLTDDGTAMESLRVDLGAILSGGAEDPHLRPGDRLVVPERSEARQNFLVAVEGAVGFPGRYPITRGSTLLSEVIRAAGGFTPEAFVRGGSVTRSAISGSETPAQLEVEQLRSLRGTLGAQDSGYYLAESSLRMKGELVTVDFHRLFVLGDSTQDVRLRPYDVVHIPDRQYTVYVFGQVRSPGHVPLHPGADLSHYVERAGGYTENARSGDVAVIKNGSRIWLAPGETEIDDGDFIWVPREPQYPPSHYITIYAQIAAIVGVAATLILLIDNLGN